MFGLGIILMHLTDYFKRRKYEKRKRGPNIRKPKGRAARLGNA
jgi:hypothetical protein